MTVDNCQPIRDKIDALESEIREFEEALPELPPRLREQVRRMIQRKKQRLQGLRAQLLACEQAA
ncbi:MAG: hypothetical protein U0821_00740 [Chloroflexota bacterium]